MEEPKINGENTGKDPVTGKFLPGNPGGGRPKGTYSLKTKIIKLLEEKPELEAKLIADLMEKEQGLLLQMVDGRPKQTTELEGKLEINYDPETKNKVEGSLDNILGIK
jgi:hypothetical protein